MTFKKIFRIVLAGGIFLQSSLVYSENENPAIVNDSPSQATEIVDEIEDLKQKVIELNRDLFILEEDLLYPGSSQVSVFLSIQGGRFFNLDTVKLSIDDDVVTSYLYTEHQLNALKKGGMQRLYIGNLKQGQHELTAVFMGTGPDQRAYKRAAHLVFEKDDEAKMLELKVIDRSSNYQPEFVALEWE